MRTATLSFCACSMLAIVGLVLPTSSDAWVVLPPSHKMSPATTTMRPWTTTRIMSSSETTDVTTSNTPAAVEEDDDDDDWEYVEFESLTEADVIGSEWLVGTCWDNNPNKIDETWCRFVTNEKGENIAVWGDNSEGKWALDAASQYITISKTNLLGKKIWACIVEDYYYLRGTVRSWTYFSAAQVEAQWQAKRLGVDPEEAGIAPWFEEDDEEEEASTSMEVADADAGEESEE